MERRMEREKVLTFLINLTILLQSQKFLETNEAVLVGQQLWALLREKSLYLNSSTGQ
jgi:hypothetical protein